MNRHWYLRVLPRTVVAGILGAAILTTSASAAVVEAWKNASHRSETSQVLYAFAVVVLLLTAASLVMRTRQRLSLAMLSTASLIGLGFALVSKGQPLGVLFVGLAPLAYAFAKASTPPRIVFHP